MWTGTGVFDLLLGDLRSLKEKRSVVRPVVAELRRRYAVSVAETGHLDLHRRAQIGLAMVAADRAHCVEVVEACERLVSQRPEIELLSARVRYLSDEDTDSDEETDSEETGSDGDTAVPAMGGPARGDAVTVTGGSHG
nr:DUF503 domain-containing protein [Frankia sp. Cppng1_Ct_nod]